MQLSKIAIFLFSFFLSFVSMLSAQKKEKTIKIKGQVASVEGSVCSYIIKVNTTAHKEYFCHVEFPHLDLDEHCRKLVVGETVILEGHMDKLNFTENHIWVHTSTIQVFNEKENRNFHLKGNVIAIQKEEDNYQAQIQTNDGSLFYAIIQVANDAVENYKMINVGETVALSGELRFLQNKAYVTVKKIH